jgi:glutathione S-transferase
VEEKGIEVDEREVYFSEEYMAELMEKGGKRQIPYLHDTDKNIQMYESDDIIEYLQENYVDSE